jgi:hypothetical protein
MIMAFACAIDDYHIADAEIGRDLSLIYSCQT